MSYGNITIYLCFRYKVIKSLQYNNILTYGPLPVKDQWDDDYKQTQTIVDLCIMNPFPLLVNIFDVLVFQYHFVTQSSI